MACSTAQFEKRKYNPQGKGDYHKAEEDCEDRNIAASPYVIGKLDNRGCTKDKQQ